MGYGKLLSEGSPAARKLPSIKLLQVPTLGSAHDITVDHDIDIFVTGSSWASGTIRNAMDDDICWPQCFDFVLLRRCSVCVAALNRKRVKLVWKRAINQVVKIGKGLLRDEMARTLALHHWLEAIDPLHRYGHNLRYYCKCWEESKTEQPFFYWLDSGEGKEVNLEDKCPRSKLRSQCVKYLSPKERVFWEVEIKDGKFLYIYNKQFLDTTGAKWIFVLSTSETLYVGQKKKGTFHHSSFLSGAATSAAGALVVENGILKAISRHSGHYLPTRENLRTLKSFLEKNGVKLTAVEIDDDGLWGYLTESFQQRVMNMTIKWLHLKKTAAHPR